MESFYATFIFMEGRYYIDDSIKKLNPIKKAFTNAIVYEVKNQEEFGDIQSSRDKMHRKQSIAPLLESKNIQEYLAKKSA